MKLEAREIKLPKTIGHWAGPDEPRVINSGNIFAYMNGAGELYLSYRFHHLEVYDYRFDTQDNIYYVQTESRGKMNPKPVYYSWFSSWMKPHAINPRYSIRSWQS